MIEKLRLLHYLKDDKYKKICAVLNLDDRDKKTKDNWILFEDKGIYKIHMFNIEYEKFGHVWFMDVYIDFENFKCSYDDFGKNLYKQYKKIFGDDIVDSFDEYAGLNCSYIEYSHMYDIVDSDKTLKKLELKCPPEQLNRELWDKYKKPHGMISAYMAKENNHQIFLLIKCYGTALKKIIKDKDLHRATGITPTIAVNEEIEKVIVDKQLKKYFDGV